MDEKTKAVASNKLTANGKMNIWCSQQYSVVRELINGASNAKQTEPTAQYLTGYLRGIAELQEKWLKGEFKDDA